jgi:hypothetical protein
MEIQNHTRFPADIFRAVVDEQKMAAALISRVTYNLEGSRLVPAEKQIWQVSLSPWEGPQGPMEGDAIFYRGGVDVFLFGQACHPGGVEGTQLTVAVEIGTFRTSVSVFGDRVWFKSRQGLVPSPPRPFTRMPLTLKHAFGGRDIWDSLEVPWADNPEGKGFYLEEGHALERPLPNLEIPEQPIRNWADKPEPAGVTICPFTSGPRLRNGLVFDKDGVLVKLKPQFYNAAFPRMITPGAQPADMVRVTGVQPSGPLVFALPARHLTVRLRFGEEVTEVPPVIDQIGIEVEAKRVFVSYRYAFRYIIHPRQVRSVELLDFPIASVLKGANP